MEDAISKEITRFYVSTLGAGPRDTRVYIVHDMIIVRLRGKLLPIEENILKTEKGVELVKNLRKTLDEITTEPMYELIGRLTARTVISAHNDVSTKTGERIQIFVLDKDPQVS